MLSNFAFSCILSCITPQLTVPVATFARHGSSRWGRTSTERQCRIALSSLDPTSIRARTRLPSDLLQRLERTPIGSQVAAPPALQSFQALPRIAGLQEFADRHDWAPAVRK